MQHTSAGATALAARPALDVPAPSARPSRALYPPFDRRRPPPGAPGAPPSVRRQSPVRAPGAPARRAARVPRSRRPGGAGPPRRAPPPRAPRAAGRPCRPSVMGPRSARPGGAGPLTSTRPGGGDVAVRPATPPVLSGRGRGDVALRRRPARAPSQYFGARRQHSPYRPPGPVQARGGARRRGGPYRPPGPVQARGGARRCRGPRGTCGGLGLGRRRQARAGGPGAALGALPYLYLSLSLSISRERETSAWRAPQGSARVSVVDNEPCGVLGFFYERPGG